MARTFVRALDEARRQEFYRQVAEAQTPDLSARDLRVLKAFERLDG